MKDRSRMLLAALLGLAACDARVVVPTEHAPSPIAPAPQDARTDDLAPAVGPAPSPSPAVVSCAAPLSFRFVSDAPAPHETAGEKTVEVVGQVGYIGPIREPLPGAQGLQREVELINDYSGQRLLLLQYALPEGIELPISAQVFYAFTIKRDWRWGGWHEALLIAEMVHSAWPVIFVGEPATTGPALELHDPSLDPLRIDLRPGPPCEVSDAICGEGATRASLRFEFSSGAGVAETVLAPGEQGTLSIFGVDHTVTNLASHEIAIPCVDEPSFRASYTIVAPARKR